MSEEQTREQLEAKLVELRKDYEDARKAQAVVDEIMKKYEVDWGGLSEIQTKIYYLETKIDPSILAMDHAKGLIKAVNASQLTPAVPRPHPGALALAREYLRLRGIEAES